LGKSCTSILEMGAICFFSQEAFFFFEPHMRYDFTSMSKAPHICNVFQVKKRSCPSTDQTRPLKFLGCKARTDAGADSLRRILRNRNESYGQHSK
jgi:hypothetical protein